MITVANRTETAARVKYTFDHNGIKIDELCEPDRTLHIDSKVLEEAESKEEAVSINETEEEEEDNETEQKLSKKDFAELLRQKVDTVGQVGKPGEQIQSVISVGMLSEGWDAKTVTHIMGLRAFTSQLLCEQVVGRGLRRTSYELNPETGFYDPEYVNIFGVPFTFLPHESPEGPPRVPQPKTEIKPVDEKIQHEITWPNVIRIEHSYRPQLKLDIDNVKTLILDASETATLAEMAPTIQGKPDVTQIKTVDLEGLGLKYRWQKITFETARDIFDRMQPDWQGNREYLLAQVIRIVEKFLASNKVQIEPPLFNRDDLRRRILFTLNMTAIVQHIWESIRFENTEKIEPVFDTEKPIRSTGDMRSWYTAKPCEFTKKSHINFCVYDSTWEASESFELDRNPNVESWVKNDHLGFQIPYIYNGIVHKYYPDFIVKLKTGDFLVLEIKGEETEKDKTKRNFLDEWVRAVNEHGGYGKWKWAVSRHPGDVGGIISKSVIN